MIYFLEEMSMAVTSDSALLNWKSIFRSLPVLKSIFLISWAVKTSKQWGIDFALRGRTSWMLYGLFSKFSIMIREPIKAIFFSLPISRILAIETLSEKSKVCMHLKFLMFQILTFPRSSALTTIGVFLMILKQVTADSWPSNSPFSQESR